MQNAAYPPQYNAGAQPVPMPEQVGYYAAPAMLGGPVPGRPSYVLPQAPSVGSWPLPPATTQMVPGMAPPPAPAEEPTKVVRAKGVARARWNRDEEERLKKLVDLGVLLRCLHFTDTTRVLLTMPWVVFLSILSCFGPRRGRRGASESARSRRWREVARTDAVAATPSMWL